MIARANSLRYIRRMNSYRQIILDHYSLRRSVNNAYSLRAFARDLGISASRLSEVLSGKQGLSLKSAEKISALLKLNGDEKEYFIDLVLSVDARSKKEREEALERLGDRTGTNTNQEMKEETFRIISDWYHFAILELMETKDFRSSTLWISGRLGISETEAEEALKRMEKLELVKKVKGRYQSTGAELVTGNDTPSHSIQKFNLQILRKAMDSVQEQKVDERGLSTFTVAMDPKLLPEIKKRILNFRDELDAYIQENNQNPSEVYCMSQQIFRLSEPLVEGELK